LFRHCCKKFAVKNILLSIGGVLAMSAPLVSAQEKLKDVLSDPLLDLRVPEVREDAVQRMQAIEKASLRRAQAKAKAKGVPMRQLLPCGTLTEIVGLDENGEFLIYTTHNVDAAISTGANLVNEAPYNLNGEGMTVGVWDAGAVRNLHQEFIEGGRVSIMDGASFDDHATHVAGTIAAAGKSPNAKGMAVNARVDSYDWNSDTSEMLSRGATEPGQADKIYISNHSYGFIAGWFGNQWLGEGSDQNAYDPSFGQYDGSAAEWDGIVYSAPYYLPFKSAGNDNSNNPTKGSTVFIGGQSVTYDPEKHPLGDGLYRNATDDPANGYENIGTTGTAKNIMTVGAANDAVTGGLRDPSKSTLTGFSSRGPTDDGRIKPDIVANGANLFSPVSGSNTAYDTYSGTSMSSPNAAGSAALLVQLYGELFPAGAMRASTLKGLIIHTATDIGNPGPDYHYGWGLMDTQGAADLIIDHAGNPTKNRMVEDQLTIADTTRSIPFKWDGESPIQVTLCWTDPIGQATSAHDERAPRLVNDLDLKIIAPNGDIYYPYIMPFVGTWTIESMSENATTGVNNTDNVEQVFIETPGQPGGWEIVVDFKGNLTNDEQDFSLLVSGVAEGFPLITRHSPTANSTDSEPVSEITLNFNQQMDPATFSIEDDVLDFTGPQGARITPTSATWSEDGKRLTLDFPTQSQPGYYRMVIGPEIANFSGEFLDQNFNEILGEPIADRYIADFRIKRSTTPVAIWTDMIGTKTPDPGWTFAGTNSSWAIGAPVGNPSKAFDGGHIIAQNLNGDYNVLENSYAQSPVINCAGFTDVTLDFRGWIGLGRNDRAYVDIWDGTKWQRILSQSSSAQNGMTDGHWKLYQPLLYDLANGNQDFQIRWGIIDKTDFASGTGTGWQLDAMAIKGVPDPTLPPAWVTSHSPSGTSIGSQPSVWLEFSQSMDTSSFSLDDIESFVGPSGPVVADGFEWIRPSMLRIDFAPDAGSGQYVLTLAPTILDQESGRPIDQDFDGIPGEPEDDIYVAAFEVDLSAPAVNFFQISGMPPSVSMGASVTDLTITAMSAADTVATDFNGTVTFGGTAGVSGTSSSFVNGVLSGVSITPSISGNALSFTVDDGAGHTGSVTFDVLTAFDQWTQQSFENPFLNHDPDADPDGDGLTNLQEFAFGTDPTTGKHERVHVGLREDLASQDAPLAMSLTDAPAPAGFQAVFSRRRDYLAAGLVYEVEFSADLTLWTSSDEGMAVISNSDDGGVVETVAVPFPATVPVAGGGGRAPNFFRVGVSKP
jgi:hypothetical protein